VAAQRILDSRFEEAEFIARIVACALEAVGVNGPAAQEMAQRVAGSPGKDVYPGCPLCGVAGRALPRPTQNQQ